MDLGRYLRKVDVMLILGVLGLVTYGTIMIASATYTRGAVQAYFLSKQIGMVVVGLVLMAVVSYFDYNRLAAYVTPIYGVNLVLLLFVKFFGERSLGAQRWISLGTFQLQPSEFTKITMVICLATFLLVQETREEEVEDRVRIMQMFAVFAPAFLFVLMQPDLGTGLVILAILLGMLLAVGTPARQYVAIIAIGLIIFGAMVYFHVLEDYQMQRLTVFLNPDVEPRGAGYQLLQSKIAIGSGQIVGKGLFSGPQTNLHFLPQRHTDFIFAVIGEELGFLGAVLLLGLQFLIISRAIRIASVARNLLGALMAIGIASMWMFQVVVNVGMTIGVMPITGIPLPFVSAGGSSMIANMMAAGLLLNVYSRRYG